MKIEILSGSPRKQSNTYRVALFLQRYLQERTNHETGLIDVRDLDMPVLDAVYQTPEQAPAHLQTVARRYLEADALILVTPEYNGSYSPTLKHFLDFFPKQARKTFGIVTASPGAFGGLRATQQLLLLVPALFGIACPQMLVVPHVTKHFSETGLLQDEQFRGAVDNFTEEFLWLAEAVNAKKINS